MSVDHVYTLHINDPGPQLAISRTLIHLRTIYCSNELKFGTRVQIHMCDMKFAPCHANLFSLKFSRKLNMQKLRFRVSLLIIWMGKACVHLRKSGF